MAVSLEDVRHVAALARLGMTDERAASLMGELNAILGHMDVLSKVDTGGVEEVAGVGAEGMRLDPDKGPATALSREPREIAPSMRDGFLLVPRLATHETADEA